MRHPKSSLAVSFVGLLCLPVMLLISGCSQSFESASGVSEPVAVGADTPGAAIAGTAFGGGLPDAYASVYLYAAAESGYGVASIPLLTSSVPSVCTAAGAPDPTGAGTSPCKDSNGNYFAVTSATGSWSIASDWTCPAANPYVYVLIVGGNTGAGINPNASFMTALAANCNTIPTHVYVNEATTVASVYALSGFMSSPTQVSSASTAASKTGLANAFATVGNLVNTATGTVYSVTPGSAASITTGVVGTPPYQNINTLANILAACEQSAGVTTGPGDGTPCGTLFLEVTPSGGTSPSDVVSAALTLAHNPAVNNASIGTSSDLYNLITSNATFGQYLGQGYLSESPYDWTMPIVFAGGGMNNLYDIAIDGNNNVWAVSDGKNGDCPVLSASTGSDVIELNNLGVGKSGTAGYTNTDIACPFAIAIDTSNQAWVVSDYVNYLAKLSTTGSVTGYTKTGNIDYGDGLAFDANGYIFITNYSSNYVSRYYPTGNTWTTYTGAGVTTSGSGISWGIAADGNGHIVIASDTSTGRADVFNDASGVLTANTGTTGYTGAGITNPLRLAVDQGNNIWVANFGASAATAPGSTLSEFSISGTTLTAASGSPFSGGGLYAPFGLAVDGGNNIWVADAAAYGVSEFNNSGTAISPAYGYIGTITAPTTSAMYFPEAVAIDESGNVWVANDGVNTGSGVGTTAPTVAGTITELVGAATPTLTPLSQATINKTPAAKP